MNFKVSPRIVLTTLSFSSSAFVKFISRHPAIEHLTLRGVEVPTETAIGLEEVGEPLLPKLVFLHAHPVYVKWIFDNQTERPNFKEVVLLTEECPPKHPQGFAGFDHSWLDDALESIHLASLRCGSPTVGFHFTLNENLNSWFQFHVDSGPQASVLTRMTGTRTLRVNCAYIVSILEKTRFQDLGRWVALFPSARELELVDIPRPFIFDSHSQILDELRGLAPQIKALKINDGPTVVVGPHGSSMVTPDV